MDIAEKAAFIIGLYQQHGHEDYIGEPVSQLEHMCQSAQLAEENGFDDEVILAAFFHDIGHLYEHVSTAPTAQMDGFGIVDHEILGSQFLQEMGFSKRICALVASHVQAKRFLTSRYPEYFQQLSEASKETLRHQGGPMSAEEAQAFESDPFFEVYIQLRKWDEMAKETGMALPELSHYENMIIQHLTKQQYANN